MASNAFATNQLLALHGRVNYSGSVLSDGNLRVFVYDANLGGNLVFDSNSDFNNSIRNGAFDVILGSGNIALDLNYGQRYFIGLRVDNTDLNFGSHNRRQFEASRGKVYETYLADLNISDSKIATNAAISWTKVSKSGASLNDLAWSADFNRAYYTQVDANNVLLNKVDANAMYGRRAVNETINGSWDFNALTKFNGGFSSGGATIQNGVVYTQSIVVLNDFNAATVTAIDMNGDYKPQIDNTYYLGAFDRRWKGIFGVDVNAATASIGTLTLANPLAVSYGGTGNTSFSAGYIPFSNGTILTSDGNLYWDNTNKRLGLGPNVSPQNRLNLIGDLNVSRTDSAVPTLIATTGGAVGIAIVSPSTTLDVNGTLQVKSNSGTVGLYQDSSGNIGVGTTTPANKLNVVGDLNVTGFSYLGNVRLSLSDINVTNINARSSDIVFISATGAELARLTSTDRFGIGTAAPANALNVVGDANITGNVTLDSNLFFVNGSTGFVGVGTNAPQNKFNVVGDLNVTGTSYLGNVRLQLNDINVTNINARTDNIIFYSTTGAERMRINEDGNIGIRDTTPDALFDVNGVGLGQSVFRIDANTSASPVIGLLIDQNARVGIGRAPVGRGRFEVYGAFEPIANGNGQLAVFSTDTNEVDKGGQIVLGGPISDTDLTRSFALIAGLKENGTGGNRAGYLQFGTRSGTGSTDISEKMRITSDGNLNVDSNTLFVDAPNNRVGIGTGVPQNTLNVIGDLNVTGVSYLGNIVLQTSDINVTNINPRDANIVFRNTSGGEIARIVGAGATSGNVGIGTAGPKSQLDIGGTGTITMASGGALLDNLYYSGGWKFRGTGYGTGFYGSAGALYFINTSASGSADAAASVATPMVLSQVGNLGIATTVPANKLNVIGDLNVATSATATPSLFVNSTDGNVGVATGSPTNTLQVGLTSFVVNNAQGRVGVGTALPQNTLNVVGDLNVTGTSYIGTITGAINTSSNAIFRGDLNAYGGLNANTIRSFDNNSLSLQTLNATRVTVLSDGNVGIGTTSPEDRLHVVSDAQSQAIHIEENSGGEDWQLGVDVDGNLDFYNSGSTTESVTIDDSGNVGIGTAGPGYKLTVGDFTVAEDKAVAVQAYNGKKASLKLFDYSTNYGFTIENDGGMAPSGVLNILRHQNSAAGTSAMAIQRDTGNVGIGTTSPGYKLDVNGSINLTNNDADVNGIIYFNGTRFLHRSGPSNLFVGSSAGTLTTSGAGDNVGVGASALTAVTTGYRNVAVGASALAGNTTGNTNIAVGRAALNANTTGSSNVAIGNNAGGLLTTGSNNIFLGYLTGDAAVTNISNIVIGNNIDIAGDANYTLDIGNVLYGVGIDSTGTTVDTDANIGIRTSTPKGALNVVGDLNVATSATATPSLFVNSTDGNVGVAIGSPANTFQVGLTSFVVNNAQGRVGVGTALPQNTLNVVGDLNVTGTSYIGTITGAINTSSNAIFRGDLNAYGGLNANTIRSFDNNTLSLQTLNATRVTVLSDGNVGIGDTTPSGILDVDTTAAADTFVINNQSGNVGIGTTGPGSKLSVVGSGATYGEAIRWSPSSNDEPSFFGYAGYETAGATTAWIGNNFESDSSAFQIRMKNAHTAVLTIKGSGSVGIGTTAPGYKLDVNGGRLFVLNAGAAITPSAATIGTFQNSAAVTDNAGLSVISGTSGISSLNMGDTGSETIGRIDYNNLGNQLQIYVNSQKSGLIESGGNSSTFYGYQAGNANTTGLNNVAFGYQSLLANTTGYYNLASGYQALAANTTGINNTATGFQALLSNTTGTRNTASGMQALASNTTGSYNTAIGDEALYSQKTAVRNMGIGYQALYLNNDGNYNAALGYQALYNNTTGNENTALGYTAGFGNTTGVNNTAVGSNSLGANTAGGYNTAIGQASLTSNTTGGYNTATGVGALYSQATANYNTGVGYQALYANNDGNMNNAFGVQALTSNTTGNYNNAFGYTALYSNTTGNSNTGIGWQALYSNTTGLSNMASGSLALFRNIGSYNTAVGEAAGQGVLNQSTFNNSTLLGYQAGFALKTGSNNIFLGYRAGDAAVTNTGNIVIGYDVDIAGDANNTLDIGNVLYGTGINSTGTTVDTDANIGVRTSTPKGALNVIGDLNVSASGSASAPSLFANSTDGNVGIGTATPRSKLEVSGDVNLSTTTATLTLGGPQLYRTAGGELVISS